MRQISIFIFLALPSFLFSQTIFWTENFNNGCQSDCAAAGYTGINGTWTQTVLSLEGDAPNTFYVSCAENGHTNGVCGTGCVPSSATATLASLHVSADQTTYGDLGAAYDAGGWCGVLWCVETDKRIESPSINCTGRTNISLNFNYIEQGQAPNDNASVYYSTNGGITWNLLVNTPPTINVGCGGQGVWTAYTIALPPACNGVSNLKIGFRWTNDDDGSGSDPSFAVDDMTLTVPGGVAPPVSAFSPSSLTVCVGQGISFTDNSTNTPTSWSWTFAGGNPATSSSQNPGPVTFSTPGLHAVTLVASNSGGAGTTATQNINVTAGPSVGASANPNPVCAGSSVTLTGTGASSYSWAPGGQTGSPISQILSSTTTFTVTGTTGSCTGTASVTVTVNQAPSVSFTGLNSSYCTNASAATLTGNPSNGTFSGTGVTGNTFSPAGAGAGTHTITYSVTVNGCTGTTSQTVTVSAPPAVSITGLNALYCVNANNATLTGVPTGGVFAGPGVSSNVFSPSVAGVGSHTITYTYGTTGCQGTASQSVTVAPLPTVSLTLNVDSMCTTDSAIALSGGVPSPGVFTGTGVSANIFNPAATGPSPGNYIINYEYTDGNNCKNSAQDNIVLWNCPVVSVDPGFTGNVTVFPNPGTGNFKIESNVSGKCKVVDMKGQVVLEFELETGVNSLDINEQPAGIYLLFLKTYQGNKVVRLEKN